MKAPSERSATANALVAVRKARGFTASGAAARHVREQTGVTGLSDSVWAAYESDARKLSVKHRDAIEAVFGPLGDSAPVEAPTASADLDRLYQITLTQAGHIADLTGAIDQQRKDIADLLELVRRLLPGPAGAVAGSGIVTPPAESEPDIESAALAFGQMESRRRNAVATNPLTRGLHTRRDPGTPAPGGTSGHTHGRWPMRTARR